MRRRALCAFALLFAASACGDNTHLTGGVLLVSPEVGLRTNETGAAATFTLSLTSEPRADIEVNVTSLDLREGTVAPPTLRFTPMNYDTPQVVTITGVDDERADGNKAFTVHIDGGRRGVVDLAVVNDDDDTAGFVISQLIGLQTSEAGTQASFSMHLLSQPAADVTVPVQSSDATEGTTDKSSLTFTETNWNIDQSVTVTGIPDAQADGAVPYSIVLSPATSADLVYKNLDPDDVLLTNLDANNVRGVTVTPGNGLATTEAGGMATFQVVLQSAPTANVTFSATSSDSTEASLSASQLVFTPTDWMTPQTVTITGVNDFVVDGAQPFTVVLGTATTTDPDYSGLDAPDVTGSNADDDIAGLIVTGGASGLTTTESAGFDTFSITLRSQPTANVTIPVSSSDMGEGTVAPTSLVFTPADWDQPHTVTVTGADDFITDGDVTYTIVVAPSTSTDPNYAGLDAADLTAINLDNDLPGFTIDPDGITVSEFGDSETFTIVLNTMPTSNVTVAITSSDTTEGTVDASSATFTSQNWNVPQTITVTGINDSLLDGNVNFAIIIGTASSQDAAYNGINPPDVAVTNFDNDTKQVYVKARKRLLVSESGQTATFRVRLTLAPSSPVTCPIQSSDLTEGTVSPLSLTFTPGQFGFQTVTVTGVNDSIVDGNIPFTILTGVCTSNDPVYDGKDPRDVAALNRDND